MSACIPWTGAVNAGTGYGKRSVAGRSWLVHVYDWTQANGAVPDGHVLDHTCHNDDPDCPSGPACLHRRCRNLEHMEPVTRGVNTARGNSPTAIAARTDRCKRNHPLTGVNVRVYGGRRYCLTCKAMHNAARRAAA